MSGHTPSRKRKNTKDTVGISTIQDVLVAIKPHTLDFKTADFAVLETQLSRLNHLLDQLLSVRNGKRRTKPEAMADELDREAGVRLWNASIMLRAVQDHGDTECRKRVFASLRLAAFRLIEAGGDVSPTAGSLVHLLQLASKTATALSDCNDARAQSVLMAAADYEGLLKDAKDETRDLQSKESATAQYYCGRMDVAWKDHNEGVAYFMLEQATDERRLNSIGLADAEEIMGRALEIGKALLRKAWGKQAAPADTSMLNGPEGIADSKTALLAVKWLQKAFQTLERAGDGESTNLANLREAILRTLARAYFASSTAVEANLERAEATLDELIKAGDHDINLFWMRLAVLKRAKAAVPQLHDAFSSILNLLEFQEPTVMSVLREIQTVVDVSVVLAVDLTHDLLHKALDSVSGTGQEFVDSIAMSLLLLVKRLNHSEAYQAVEKACQAITRRVDFNMDKTSAAACQLVLWRNGEASYKGKKWTEAAEWFTLSASSAFQSTTNAQSRCIRKAALCYIQQGEYAQASMLVSRCPNDESSTHYVKFLAAVHQGLEGEAIQAVGDMVKASDFDRKMLLLATQLAHETKQKTLLLAILEAMLRTLQQEPQLEAESEGITLVRCSVRIILDLLKEPLAASTELIESLKVHLQRALDLIGAVTTKGNLAVVAKDVSWLWRTAYNAAVSGCRDWDELAVAELFDLARGLMETYSVALVASQDPDMKQCMLLSSFSAVSGRLFVARRLGSSDDAGTLYEQLANDIPTLRRSAVQAFVDGTFDDDRPNYIVNILFTFEVEVLCRIQAWEKLQILVETATETECVTAITLEAIADLLWTEEACPTDVLYSALEAMLRSSLDSKHISIEKFSRWLRALCTILLARNKQQDRANALSFIEQAVEVIKENPDESGDQMYAHDEREWLLHIAFNTGVERFTVSDFEEAKRWIETATVLAGLVHNSQAASEKINAMYQQVLARYGS
ncbi:hypothetical protein BDV93DRAFT_609374 [Ceratobasidium sp. AG-I]|nr:hypothetical protein BDV93DRAFT_609374 [Ceratobasidium sp. AG-I]